MDTGTIPKQEAGASSTTKYAVKLKSPKDAEKLYRIARENLLNVNAWHILAGKGSAKFTVIDATGQETNQSPIAGNYLRIAIPFVPGSSSGDGYEWVIVEKIEEQTISPFSLSIQVRPDIPPFYNKNEVAHFFSEHATSTFSVELRDNKVIAQVNGRNEKPNKKVHSLFDKIRNMIIALFAMIGLNKPQWKKLVKGLLREKERK